MHSGPGIDSNLSSVENDPLQIMLLSVWFHIHLLILFSVLERSDLKMSSPESWILKVTLEIFQVVSDFSILILYQLCSVILILAISNSLFSKCCP